MADPPKEFDLGGDAFIVVGPEGSQVRIKVLSGLLMMVSQYFRALFGPHFKEGSEVSQSKEITLKDDDPHAFTLLCKILHMQYKVPNLLEPDQLLGLAIVADKYGCVEAMALTLPSIFPEPDGKVSFSKACRLAAAAYLFDHPGLFKKHTRHLIFAYASPMLEGAAQPSGVHIPTQAWLTMECKRSHLRAIAAAGLSWSGLPSCTNAPNCPRFDAVYATHSHRLVKAGILPLDLTHYSIETTVWRLDSVVDDVPISSLPSTCRSGHCIPQNTLLVSGGRYKVLAQKLQEQCEGLCIDCVISGGKSKGKCRIVHS